MNLHMCILYSNISTYRSMCLNAKIHCMIKHEYLIL